ncbi:MAG: hypothetical protein R3311_15055, partial [Oceanisphaera sp.]|nr:hypothetical protein [Oceanisphaera sp.]
INPAELDGRLDQRLMAWEAARKTVGVLDEQLQALGRDPGPRISHLEEGLDAVAARIQLLRDETRTAQGELIALSARAPYSRVATLKERARDLADRIAGQTLERRAVRLLHDTLLACQREATADLTRPVARRAVELLRQIDGNRWAGLDLDDDFAPATLRPRPIEEAVAPETLSGGEQEQLHLVVRLALAEVLAADHREMLVLDDPLTATDPQRLAHIRQILRRTAQSLQVVILTCHPQRYQGLMEGDFFDLAQLRAADGSHSGLPDGRE